MCQTESCPHLFRDLGGQRPRQGQGGGRSEAHADAHRKSSSCDQRWCSGTASLRVSATPAFLMPIRRKRTPSPKALISCDLQARPPGSDCRERDGQDLRDPCRCRSRSTSSPGPGRRSRTRPAARRSAAGTRSATCHFLLESRPEVWSAHPGRYAVLLDRNSYPLETIQTWYEFRGRAPGSRSPAGSCSGITRRGRPRRRSAAVIALGDFEVVARLQVHPGPGAGAEVVGRGGVVQAASGVAGVRRRRNGTASDNRGASG
jgi:hypothetical protein